MLLKAFICTFAFATLTSAAVAKQVPNANWDKYAGERHPDSHHDSHRGVHAREAEPVAIYQDWWHHAQGFHAGPAIAKTVKGSVVPRPTHHARDAEPEAATSAVRATQPHSTHPHPTPTTGSWTKPSDWASWWSSHPHPTPVHRGREHHARDTEPEAEAGFAENTWNEVKKKLSNVKLGNTEHNKPFDHHDTHKVRARDAEPEAEAAFQYGGKGAHDYDLNADWHKKFLAEHGVKFNSIHARDVEGGPDSSDGADYSEEGYGEPLQARDVPAEGEKEVDFTSDDFVEKLYARSADIDDEDGDEAQDAYHKYLQTSGLDESHLTGPAPEGEDYEVDHEEISRLAARDVEDEDESYEDGDDEEGTKLAARDARNAFFAGQGAHPNNARAQSEAHRKLLAAKIDNLPARDVESEADETVAEYTAPAAEETEEPVEPEIDARGLPTGLPKNLPTVSFKRPSQPTQTGRSGFGNLFGKAW